MTIKHFIVLEHEGIVTVLCNKMNGYDMNYSQARKFDSYGVEPKNQYEGLDNGDPRNIQEFHLTKNEHYNSSSSTVPSNLRMVDSNVSRQMHEPSPRNKRTNTKVIHETLDDGTVISRQIVVEEEETLVERRLYKYEPTSPLMNRKHDPASAMAVQTGVHQAADLGYEGDEHTRSNSKSSSRTSHWMPSSSKLNDEIPVPPRPANYRPSTSSQHQVYEGVNMGHATDTSLNGAVNARYVIKNRKPVLQPLASSSMFGSGFVSSAASLSQTCPSFVSSPTNGSSSPESKAGITHPRNNLRPLASSSVLSSNSPVVSRSFLSPSCNQYLVDNTSVLASPSADNVVSSRDPSVHPPLFSVSSHFPFHSSVSVLTKTTEPFLNSYQSSRSLKNKNKTRVRSSSQSSLGRKTLELSKNGPIDVDDAPVVLKSSLRSRSHPVLAAYNLDNLISYPEQVLPNDEIQPLNELSSTGFSPINRNAYRPYRSLFSSSRGENLNESSDSAQSSPIKDNVQNSAITPQMRTKSVELRHSDLASPVESRYGMVVDSSPDSSVDNLHAYFSNDRAAVFSDSDAFDPQCDSGIDLPGKNLTFPSSLNTIARSSSSENYMDTIKKRPILAEKQCESKVETVLNVESRERSCDAIHCLPLEDDQIVESENTNLAEQGNNGLVCSPALLQNHPQCPNKLEFPFLTSNPLLSSDSFSSLVCDSNVSVFSSSIFPSKQKITGIEENYKYCFSSPTRKFPNLASPNSTNSDTESTNRGFEGPNGCNHSVVSPTQMVYREKRFPVADVSPYRAEQNNNPNGCPPYNEHIYKSVQSSNITGFPHPSEKEFESLDPNSKFNLIKNLTDGDYAYRTFDSNRGTHSSRSTGADKANRNADLHGQLSSEKPRSRSKLGYNESFRNATKDDLYCNEIEMGEASQGMSSLYGRSGPDYEATGLQSLRVRDDIPNASGPKSAGPVVGNVNEHRVYASSTGDLLKAQKPLNVKSDHDLNASMNTYDTPTGSDENFRHNFHPKGQHQRNRSDIIQKESLTTHGFPIVNTHSSGSGSMAANATRNLSVDNIVSAGNSDALGNYDNAGKYARQQKQQRSSENMFNRPETAVTTTTTVREPVSQRMQSLFPNEVNAQNIASERVAQPRRGVVEKQFDPTHAKPNSSYGNQ